MLNKDDIKAFDDRPFALVDVWGGQVKVRAMSVKDRIAFENKQKESKSNTEIIAVLVMYTCCDENGNRIFSDDDLGLIEDKSPSSLLKIFNASINLNLLDNQVIEDNAKNS